MSQSENPKTQDHRPRRPVEVTEDDFAFRAYNQAGREGIVATAQVPNGVIWAPRPNAPVTVALTARQDFSIDENAGANQVIDLNPNAPIVPYMDDPTAGEYTEDAYIVGYFDSTGDGVVDTRITGASEVQFNGTFTTADGFVDSFEVDDTSGGVDAAKPVAFFVVQRQGYATIQKRSSGKANVTQSLQQETQIKWAFNTPNDPNSAKQVTWDARATGKRGALPPKFNLDIVFFDDAETVQVDDALANNLRIVLPLEQRKLGPDEDPRALRARVRQQMAEG